MIKPRIQEIRMAWLQRSTMFSASLVAQRVGVDKSTLANWEAGRTTPSRVHAIRLAQALGVSVAELGLARTEGDPEITS